MANSSSIDKVKNKPHAVCIPYPAQGHINPMFKLAKLLHHKAFHITFVNTEFNHNRLLKSKGSWNSMEGLPSFRFEAIPDGLPPSGDADDTQHPGSLYTSISACLGPFKELLVKLNDNVSSNMAPPVSCIVVDRLMSFTLLAAEMLGIPEIILCTVNPRAILALAEGATLVEKDYLPLKDASCRTDEYLDTIIEDIPNLKGMRLRDLPGFMVRADVDPRKFPIEFGFQDRSLERALGFIFNTFDDLERDVLDALRSMTPSVYAIGPLNLLEKLHVVDDDMIELGSNLWKEETECLEWLDLNEPNSVVYVSFGTTTSITSNQLIEFAWGLANSNQAFLWVISRGLVSGGRDDNILPPEFHKCTKERGMVVKWCPQEKVLGHPSIGGFLTHGGWNSTLESISKGVPMICFSGGLDHTTIRWSCCKQWGIGMELDDGDVKRDEVERVVRELVVGEKGKEMRKRALEWKKMAQYSAYHSSLENLDKLIDQVLNFATPN